MFGLENIFGDKMPEKPKNEIEETPTEPEEKEAPKEVEGVDKRKIGLSQKTKEQLSAKHPLNLDGTLHIPADEAFENNQERAA